MYQVKAQTCEKSVQKFAFCPFFFFRWELKGENVTDQTDINSGQLHLVLEFLF